MKLFYSILLIIFIGLPYQSVAQINNHTVQEKIYKDRIIDQYGVPLVGVRVSVIGKGIHTYSDMDGNFSIKAGYGDEIVLTKNGKHINSYRLDGSIEYEVQDLSQDVVTETKNKFSKRVRSYDSQNTILLDSASFYQKKDPFKSLDFVELYLKSRKRHTKADLIKIHTLLGDNYTQLRQYDLAISNYQNALRKSNDTDLTIKLAKAQSKNKDYHKSNQTYQLLLARQLSPWQETTVNEGLGNNAKFQKNKETAINYFQKALQIASKHAITPKISSLNAKIAELLSDQGEKTQANLYIQNTIQAVTTEPIKKRALLQKKVADVYQKNKDYDNEIQIRKQTLAELEEAQVEDINIESDDEKESKISTSQLNLDIGRAYLDKNEYDKAIPYLEKSISKANEGKNLEVQKNAIKKLSELYKKIGNSKKALQNYQEFARLVEALYKQKEKEIKAATTLNNELRAKQNRISTLEKDRELSESRYQLSVSEQELTRANYRRQKLLIYGLLFGLILISIALFFMYRSNKQRRLANNLLALKTLRSQMNPHFIFNALNSVNSFIAQNDERTANRYLTNFSTLMRNVLNNSEEDFIPLEKEIDLLKLYLQLEHSRFKDKFEYHINVDSQINLDDFMIPPMLLQPYVENAVWHGLRYKKTKGKLQIDFKQIDTETIEIHIIDDGIGRAKSKELKTQNQKKQQSKGMGNIKKRIRILNEMYSDKVDVFISDLKEDYTGTKVILILKKD
jgi:tetratricopeptide (TPR) repeat protein